MDKLKLVNEMFKENALNIRKEKDGENYNEIPLFKAGDQVNVAVRVSEGNKERIQNYKGVVISRQGAGLNETFTVRKISNGVGVERIFPIFSPALQKIEILKVGRVRRAKLFYLRGMSDKKTKQKLS
jgi:large subunit ribosomal protein L19